jgi:hypothetical protein
MISRTISHALRYQANHYHNNVHATFWIIFARRPAVMLPDMR